MSEQLSEHISQHTAQMAQVLVKIVNDKYQWIAERKAKQPLASFHPLLTRSDRDFYQALSGDNTVFILECKKASPSKGLIRANFDLDEIACVYDKYADAISVLTDEKYFQGRFEFLPQVRAQVSQPVLCKDFMLDPYQVYLARHYQADAILLMLSILNDDQYRQLAAVAHDLGMGVLTEVSNQQELNRALALNAKVIGINNRNLRDLSTDLNRTKQLAPLIPAGTIIISESGIYTHQQVRDLATFAHGFLIGSSLMAQANLELAVRKIVLGEHKVCGLTRANDAAKAYQAGAVFGGLIFVEQSKRVVDVAQARLTMCGAPLHYVGVEENAQYVRELRATLPASIEIWKAYGVSDTLPQLLTESIDRHLLDAQIGAQSGGTGHSFDWRLLPQHHDLMLAGGLSAENVAQAAQLGCRGLDFNSGVESAPGQKDANKLQQVFQQLRNY